MLVAAAVASLDLGAKVWAQAALPPRGVETGPVDLLLGYNSGIAFSLGADAPSAVVLALAAAITAGIAVAAWRVARWGSRALLGALALVLGGALLVVSMWSRERSASHEPGRSGAAEGLG